jgi:hypothetical protein
MRNPSNAGQQRDAELAASSLGVDLVTVDVHSPEEIDAAFQTLKRPDPPDRIRRAP